MANRTTEVVWNRDSTVVCFSVDGVVKQKYTSMFGGQTRSYFSLTGAKLVFECVLCVTDLACRGLLVSELLCRDLPLNAFVALPHTHFHCLTAVGACRMRMPCM